MIIDSIKNLKNYSGLNPLFPKAIAYINSLDFANLAIGKVELDGKNMFSIISESTLKTCENAKLEVHNNYIDIQIPVSKTEGFGWSQRVDVSEEKAPFDEVKDIQFFEDKSALQFNLPPNNFVIFFPQDAHAPCIGEGTVTKIVIKVKVNS
ncbi:MAG: hypothetical protein RL662_2170 [Bacteroidota bacterium]|jgi:YhcH/YjgK/YiaL family protein